MNIERLWHSSADIILDHIGATRIQVYSPSMEDRGILLDTGRMDNPHF